MRHKRFWFTLLSIVSFSLFLRFYKLNSIPSGVSHDELEYVNNGYSLVKTGRDLAGYPLQLTLAGFGFVSLPAYLVGPVVAIFGLNQFSVRLLPAVWGIVEILLVCGISYQLFKNWRAALFASAFLALSAWGLKISRVMFDPPTALFWFLSAVYFARRTAFSLFLAGLGLLSYYGAVFIYPLFVLLIFRRIKLISIFIILLTIFIYFLTIKNSTHRASELITTNVPDEVVFSRFHSTAPAWLDRLFVNKATVILHRFFNNYLGAFSLQMIFINGDPQRVYSLWNRGELELILLPLIIIGLVKSRSKFLLALLLIAPITSGLSSPVYATRSFLLWPVLFILAGLGATKLSPKLLLIFIPVFLYSSLQTIHQYFYLYPTYASEMWFESEKQLALFLKANPNGDYKIYAPEARQMWMQYLFYSKFDRSLDNSFIPACDLPVGQKVIVHNKCYPDSAIYKPLIRATDKSDRTIWLTNF